MQKNTGFAVVGCSKCRRLIVADLAYATKTCICGYRLDLGKTKLLAVSESADIAGEILRQMQTRKNSGFTTADKFSDFTKKED
ncbi:MAG: DUF1922 domain-containing protein [Methanocorpusculum sp.]|jgi:hypothetical protein|nr:DUF1922 domain-containing protein [Methanocorpusculum sp.]MDD2470546.1 DUF1922 domain-containing protein [Methanocorpusculum sp.]MDD3256813.1 DUF1922 domain-containing protein [Methanocorpusculum sp.]MDD4132584.1 DUF1922 domain-containing protein [Methanocorpusculum sp.]